MLITQLSWAHTGKVRIGRFAARAEAMGMAVGRREAEGGGFRVRAKLLLDRLGRYGQYSGCASANAQHAPSRGISSRHLSHFWRAQRPNGGNDQQASDQNELGSAFAQVLGRSTNSWDSVEVIKHPFCPLNKRKH
jgi:hypothetical protein